MRVLVRVRLLASPIEGVCMLVMFVVPMTMGVDERFVHMLVLVPLRQVEPHACRHQARCDPEGS